MSDVPRISDSDNIKQLIDKTNDAIDAVNNIQGPFASELSSQIVGQAQEVINDGMIQIKVIEASTKEYRDEAEQARDAAFDSVQYTYIVNTAADLDNVFPTPVDGNTAYVRNTEEVWKYNASVWINFGLSPTATKANTTYVENLAGKELDMGSTDIRIECDEFGNVVYREKSDGTREMVGVQVGDFKLIRNESGACIASGIMNYEDTTTLSVHDLSGQFQGAVKIVCDELGNVIYVEWPDGRIESTEVNDPIPEQASYQTLFVLPDVTVGRFPKGFTCTGLDRITRGEYAGCWVIGDDGRIEDTTVQPYIPRVHILDPECRYILRTIDPGYADASLQGVAIDTSGVRDTLWIATAGDNRILHFELDGTPIPSDTFVWSFAGNINGIAYDPVNHALWAAPTGGGTTARLISCNPATSPRVIQTITLASSSPDQMHFDSVNKLLYYTQGGNGSNGQVRVFNLNTSVDTAAYSNLKYAQAIEGIYIDRAIKKMFIVNDAGYHRAGSPNLNCMIIYTIPLLGE